MAVAKGRKGCRTTRFASVKSGSNYKADCASRGGEAWHVDLASRAFFHTFVRNSAGCKKHHAGIVSRWSQVVSLRGQAIGQGVPENWGYLKSWPFHGENVFLNQWTWRNWGTLHFPTNPFSMLEPSGVWFQLSLTCPSTTKYDRIRTH